MVWSPEVARLRDLHRYYQPWRDAQVLDDVEGDGFKALTSAGYEPQSTRDRALTAFAQLATLRLNTQRALISLIDSNRQYILADATRTLSLFSPNHARTEDEMWLGNAVLSRDDAVCHHALTSTHTSLEEDGNEYEAACMFVPDCLHDPRFSDRNYTIGPPSVRFYAGVPIITKAGYKIGVYAVSDDRPRQHLSASEVRFMQDLAAAVMEHLEFAKSHDDRNKGEHMVSGLTEFIERSSVHDKEDTSHRQTTMEKQTENARREALDEEAVSNAPVSATDKPPACKRDIEHTPGTSQIFQRAAHIMRQSTNTDGVIFFDTSAAGIKGHNSLESGSAVSSDEGIAHPSSELEIEDPTTKPKRRRKQEVQGKEAIKPSVPSKACPVAGFALREEQVVPTKTDFDFTETEIERYINRYPQGKCFSFSEEGVAMNSSDGRSERSENENLEDLTNPSYKKAARRSRGRKDVFAPSEFLKTVPNVRSLIFLPLWDLATERWLAGAFIWTTAPGRLTSPENELLYLRAFGNCITSEIARWNAQRSDLAKTTFLASISHELRSPLHGILGSVEFLRETGTSAYQDSLVASIQTCGRTLLDTIDHVLDHAKINKLQRANSRHKQRGEGRQKRPTETSGLGVTTDFDLAQLVEDVCETVCAGHSFRKTSNAHSATLYDPGDDVSPGQTLGRRSEQHDTSDQKGDSNGQTGVAVSLRIHPLVNWVVRSHPGALRRVVMNLVGNALKYTLSGFIDISLLQQGSNSEFVDFEITIQDTGKGISAEFQQKKLFAPFSQEDPFSTGTGLGLSIVKQIVESLKGEVEVTSNGDIGTTVKVVLRLRNGQMDKAFKHTPEELKGTSASIIIASETGSSGQSEKSRESIRQACSGLGVKVSEDPEAPFANIDFLLTDAASIDQILAKRKPAPIDTAPLEVLCICVDAAEKRVLDARISQQVQALGWNLEIIAQPCGPRKLARVLLHCKRRASNNHHHSSKLPTSPVSAVNGIQSALHVPGISPGRSPSELPMKDPLTSTSAGESHTLEVPIAQLSFYTQSSPNLESPDEYFSPRVLLVDDNAINLKLLIVFAKRQKLRYSEAVNGLEALEMYKKEALSGSEPSKPFDFVLMDLSMPVMDGFSSTRAIREFEAENQIPRTTIVALTGLAGAQDQEAASNAGMDMYLVKPVKFADIRKVLHTK